MYRTAVALALFASSACVAVAAQPDPADPAAAAPAVNYESAFTGYQPFREEEVRDWRALNEEVSRAGGHIGIMGGARGHAGHGSAKPAGKAAPGASAEPQPAVRGAPQAPAGGGHKH